MKKYFDRRHNTRIPHIQLNDLLLIRKGLPGMKQVYMGQYRVVQTAVLKGVLKRVGYINDDNVLEFATIGNAFLYHRRRDESSKRGSVRGSSEEPTEALMEDDEEELVQNKEDG
ncbi:hypothetical protein HPB50_021725 [Hyalomma asiaticum]|uniref:Uncharacterized protein n=1 Tax=Hyalomma asiaticum TaxID=266040 RepID=A0ACB7S4V7_HYAAI|nr:hypothetical protein HPB50_021725 [Hyalomma asiaticum]